MQSSRLQFYNKYIFFLFEIFGLDRPMTKEQEEFLWEFEQEVLTLIEEKEKEKQHQADALYVNYLFVFQVAVHIYHSKY